MSKLWDRLWELLGIPQTTFVPAQPKASSFKSGYPNTFTSIPAEDQVKRPELFDPSLRHFPRAFRHGDPLFEDPAVASKWQQARRAVMDGLIKLMAESPHADKVVLRGSRLMASWFPNEARDPGDLDWVVFPASIQINHRQAKELLADTVALLEATASIGDIQIIASEITSDQIWSYERSPGVRLMIPWKAEGIPNGSVQMDFVFGETLPIPSVMESITLSDGSTTRVNVATPELSLAWKVQWLLCDTTPQGKDLYDAVLLAESVALSFDLLQNLVVRADPWWKGRTLTNDQIQNLDVDWEPFLVEYPWVQGSMEEWRGRLAKALVPMFDRNRVNESGS